jgi:galactokinase
MLDAQSLREEFVRRFGDEDIACYFSPGRVNLIGEHIDYNGGFVLPAAISLGITALVSSREDNLVRIYANGFQQEVILDLNQIPLVTDEERHIHWSDYIAATLQVLTDNGMQLSGKNIWIDSDLPLGSGLSSSAALECLIAFIFNETYFSNQRTELALDAQRAEREYVGVNCGIMDQFAVSNGKYNQAMLLDCATLEFEYIPADFKNYELVIINSNKPRALAESKYNERRKECDEAYALLSAIDPAPNLCHVHEISLSYLADDTLYKRAKHAVLENKRVLYAAEALKSGNIEAFGELLTESHRSLDADYEVSGLELNTIVHYSTHFEGCIGARMTGAGFGGCCIALVEKDKAVRFMHYVCKKYEEKTGRKADAYSAEISDGVRRIY